VVSNVGVHAGLTVDGSATRNGSVCTGRPIADIHNGEGDAGAKHDLDAQAHTTVQAASGQGDGRPQWRWRPMGRAELGDLHDGYSQYRADQSRA